MASATLALAGTALALAGTTATAIAVHGTWDDSLFQLLHLKLAHALLVVIT